MTREETLDWLYRLKSEIYVYMPRPWLIPMGNALDMAIKALEQEPKQMVEIDLYSVIKQKYIEREVLDKIRAEIETQEKWLLKAGYNSYNVDIAFSSIKSVLAESENKE